ncbi:OmpA family protein [Adhaeribacter terreus]|uniref:OmpA family protein n=1 Tax=Adhaeribacter terreus TaxID=529703 RepID=A0ABW0EE08_9BACT
MHKNLLVVIILLLAAHAASAQKYVWAWKVHKVSSQRASGKDAFSPDQVLGEPNALPLGEPNSQAWSPKKDDEKEEVIEVRFVKSLVARQVSVVENANPGSITKIELIDTGGKPHEVYTNEKPGPLSVRHRVLSVSFPAAKYRTIGVRVTMNTAAVAGVNQIDAIGIADTEESFVKKELKGKQEIAFDTVMENIGESVNSIYTETRPVISSDGKTLFFARQNHPKNTGGSSDGQDVWFSPVLDPKEQTWGPARNLGGPINNAGNNGVTSVSADGNTLLLINTYNPDGTISPEGASISTRTKNGWSMPVKLNILNYYNKSNENVDYFLANSGKTLLMAVTRNDGVGGQDLFVSFLQKFGVWSKPLNLGKTINTKKSEFAPFLAADGKTLFFASDGHKGYGKSDIFYSKRLDDTWQNWSTPLNLGPNINSKDWDAYYTVAAAGDYAYLVSTRNGTGNSEDIFKIKLVSQFKPEPVILVTGKVLDAKTQKPLEAKIVYESLVTGEELGVAQTNPVDGSYTIVLPSGTSYGYMAEADGYIAVNENIDATETTEYTEINRDLFLVPFEVGAKITLNNIFFAQSRSYLRESSFSELNRLVKIMKENPSVVIRLEGHTDNQGDSKLNMQLSIDRVNAVRKYLTDKGIEKKRIETVGFGDSKPVASNAKEETRRLNRRVEFTVLKK